MSDKLVSNFYEVLETIEDETGSAKLHAMFTPNNGIRIIIEELEDDDSDGGACEFDFTDEQAEMVGQALVQWAQRKRAVAELVRCNMRVVAVTE